MTRKHDDANRYEGYKQRCAAESSARKAAIVLAYNTFVLAAGNLMVAGANLAFGGHPDRAKIDLLAATYAVGFGALSACESALFGIDKLEGTALTVAAAVVAYGVTSVHNVMTGSEVGIEQDCYLAETNLTLLDLS